MREAELEERRRQHGEVKDSLSKITKDRQEISSQLEELNSLNSSLTAKLRDQVLVPSLMSFSKHLSFFFGLGTRI